MTPGKKLGPESDSSTVYEPAPVQLVDPLEPGADRLTPPVAEPASPADRPFGGGIIRAALIISIGNIMTRVFGVARESVLAALFGTAGYTAAFTLADNVLTIFFGLLVSGAISSALIPVLSRYAADQSPQKRAEFWHIVNTLLTLGLIFLVRSE